MRVRRRSARVCFDEEQEPLLRVGSFQPDKALQEIVDRGCHVVPLGRGGGEH